MVLILERLQSEAQAAGGEAPLPAQPDTTIVRDLRELAGNRQIVGLAEKSATLIDHHRDWSAAGEAARERLPEWQRLERLLHHARTLPVATELNPQMDAIRSQRSLLSDPNPISPLLSKVTDALRKTVSDAHGRLRNERDREVTKLERSGDWLKLEPSDRARILTSNGLIPIPDLNIGTDQALMECLNDMGLHDWDDRLLALKPRVDRAREEVARLLAPKAITVRPTPATLNSREDVEDYIQRLREQLLAQVDEHPIIIP